MKLHLSVERLSIRLEIGDSEMADVFSRIALAVAALQAGDNSALQSHVRDIDAHLTSVDDEILGLQGDDTSSKNRLDAIEAGISKIADAFDGGAAAGSTSGDGSASGANPGGGSDSGAVSGTGSDAGNPGGTSDTGAQSGTGTDAGNPGGDGTGAGTQGDASGSGTTDQGPIPASGAGSETHGQVDTPVTQP